MHHLSTPIPLQQVPLLKSGDQALISGTIYTARDAAHKRLTELIDKGEPLPVDLSGHLLYYTGPTPPKPGEAIGSAGPTTASRMDAYTPKLLAATGLRGIIGKGNRGPVVIESFKKYQCLYFAATGGAGALLSRCIRKSRVVCYGDLGPEAIYELEVADFPVVVAIDTAGSNVYVEGPTQWRDRER